MYVAGATRSPDSAWVTQQARNVAGTLEEQGAPRAVPYPGPRREVHPLLHRGLGGPSPADAGPHRLDGFRQMEMPFWLAATLVEHCGWLRSQARVDDAVPLANEARDILLGLGARPWLERLERAVPAATVEPVPAGP